MSKNKCYLVKNNGNLGLIIFIPFYALSDFVDIVGENYISDVNIKGHLKDKYIVIDLFQIIKSYCFSINSFNSVLPKSQLKEFEAEIKEFYH